MPIRAPTVISLKPRKHHGFFVLIWLCGLLLPPLAVAVRFGIGTDFFINVILTICGYFPGHFHNFYIQNIRNNYNKKRTPKWARKLGLVDEAEFERKKKKSQWSGRYQERNAESTMVGAELAEGEEGSNYDPAPVLTEEQERRARVDREGRLWRREEDEEFYGDGEFSMSERGGGSGGWGERGGGMRKTAGRRWARWFAGSANQRHWHYPANFEDADAAPDRFDRTRAARASPVPSNPRHKFGRNKSSKADKRAQFLAYAPNGNNNPIPGGSGGFDDPLDASRDGDVPEWGKDYGASRKKSGRTRSDTQGSGSIRNGRTSYDRSSYDRGGDYGYGSGEQPRTGGNSGRTVEENWDHQF
ncbi:hypothetical protein NliqN6_2350 [Naganishia liquefaciens]|uniref:YqaE/Pmp3 family membrane protein n=1 Tax=Naganishia liquefaciens TaxID=104408 RepID=A0A8H3TRR3_9TREE|nr:hypothetical protein NliqN6_2350 [Naganishia liquefaciens]